MIIRSRRSYKKWFGSDQARLNNFSFGEEKPEIRLDEPKEMTYDPESL